MARDPDDDFNLTETIPMGYELDFPWFRVIQAVVSVTLVRMLNE